MKKIPFLSQSMIFLGITLILVGIGWGVWSRLHRPPEPQITEAGAVVLAVTVAPPTPTPIPAAEPSPPPTIPPTVAPSDAAPTPDLLPAWTVPPDTPTPHPTAFRPTPTATPSPTPWLPAEQPPTRIVAPAIGLDAPVVPMGWAMVDRDGVMKAEWEVPANAAGWHMNSALPGHGGNVVLSGHHNIKGKVFRYVVDLNPGDEIFLYVGDTVYPYIVTEKYILKEAGMPLHVRRKNAQWIMPTDDERLTLVTCWPYEWPGNSHRVIVVAHPPEYWQSLIPPGSR